MLTVRAGYATVAIELNYADACELADDIERAANVLDDEGCQDPDKERVKRLELLVTMIRHEAGHLLHAAPARVPSDMSAASDAKSASMLKICKNAGLNVHDVSLPGRDEPEPSGDDGRRAHVGIDLPEEAGRRAFLPGGDLPKYVDILAAHIPVQHREFTVRIYQCDFNDRRFPNEALARTFPTEEKARDFYGRTQNIQNMKVRNKEAHAIDVVLGVQDKRSHAKKKSYREWEHALCKGGPG